MNEWTAIPTNSSSSKPITEAADVVGKEREQAAKREEAIIISSRMHVLRRAE